MSDPDVEHARQALADLEMLVVQDIFLTETRTRPMSYCPLLHSREDGHVHRTPIASCSSDVKALEPPGEAQQTCDHRRDGETVGSIGT